MSEVSPIRIGFDVGNVILRNDTDSSEAVSFLNRRQSYVDGALEAIGHFVTVISADNAFIISKCGPTMQERTSDFLDSTDFYGQTGFDRDHVLFCRHRSEKAPIAASLGLTDFVDDRLDILRSMTTVKRKYLFQRPGKPRLLPSILGPEDGGITITYSWAELEASIPE